MDNCPVWLNRRQILASIRTTAAAIVACKGKLVIRRESPMKTCAWRSMKATRMIHRCIYSAFRLMTGDEEQCTYFNDIRLLILFTVHCRWVCAVRAMWQYCTLHRLSYIQFGVRQNRFLLCIPTRQWSKHANTEKNYSHEFKCNSIHAQNILGEYFCPPMECKNKTCIQNYMGWEEWTFAGLFLKQKMNVSFTSQWEWNSLILVEVFRIYKSVWLHDSRNKNNNKNKPKKKKSSELTSVRGQSNHKKRTERRKENWESLVELKVCEPPSTFIHIRVVCRLWPASHRDTHANMSTVSVHSGRLMIFSLLIHNLCAAGAPHWRRRRRTIYFFFFHSLLLRSLIEN